MTEREIIEIGNRYLKVLATARLQWLKGNDSGAESWEEYAIQLAARLLNWAARLESFAALNETSEPALYCFARARQIRDFCWKYQVAL